MHIRSVPGRAQARPLSLRTLRHDPMVQRSWISFEPPAVKIESCGGRGFDPKRPVAGRLRPRRSPLAACRVAESARPRASAGAGADILRTARLEAIRSSADRQDESRDVPDDPRASPGQHVRPARRCFCVEEVDVTLVPRIRNVLVEQRPRRNMGSIGLGDHDVDDEAAEERVASCQKAMRKPRRRASRCARPGRCRSTLSPLRPPLPDRRAQRILRGRRAHARRRAVRARVDTGGD